MYSRTIWNRKEDGRSFASVIVGSPTWGSAKVPLLGLYRSLIANTIIIKKGRPPFLEAVNNLHKKEGSHSFQLLPLETGSTRRIIRRNWVEITAEECYTSNNNIQSVNFLSFFSILSRSPLTDPPGKCDVSAYGPLPIESENNKRTGGLI